MAEWQVGGGGSAGPGKAYFAGIVLPPCPETLATLAENAHEFTKAESHALAPQLLGLPVALNHKNDVMTVGTITDAWHAKDDSLIVMGEMGDDMEGLFAQHAIADELYKGLSLQHTFEVLRDLRDEKGRFTNIKTPIEVSLCPKGRRPNTDIFFMVPEASAAQARQRRDGQGRWTKNFTITGTEVPRMSDLDHTRLTLIVQMDEKGKRHPRFGAKSGKPRARVWERERGFSDV
jgi:hypothetical protein